MRGGEAGWKAVSKRNLIAVVLEEKLDYGIKRLPQRR